MSIRQDAQYRQEISELWAMNASLKDELRHLEEQLNLANLGCLKRDKTILEQQARIDMQHRAIGKLTMLGNVISQDAMSFGDLAVLKSALKAERIKALEEASAICTRQSELYCDEGGDALTCAALIDDLKK